MDLCCRLWPDGIPMEDVKWPEGEVGDFAKAVKFLALGSVPCSSLC